jgi:Na+-driven multidrug efflux pump
MKKMAKENSQEYRKTKMLTEPIPKIITSMAVPSIIAFLINSIYSMADTYFVSGLGINATAAVSVNTSLDQIIMMAGSLLAVGANSYIARLLGAKDEKKASQVLSTAFMLAVVFGVAVMILGTVFMRPMVRLLGATPTCEQYSIDYATYILLAAPFMAASFVMNQCLRAEGSAMLSMIGMGFGGILNCVLDPIFIMGLNLGVAGASMATAISKLVSFGILIFPYLTHRSILRISLKYFHPTQDILSQIVKVGSSSMFRSGLAVVAAIMLNNIAGQISDAVLAGIGVSTKVMMFPFGIILGFGTGFQPVVGFCWGAKRYDRVRAAFRFSAWTAAIGGGIMGLTAAIFAGPIIGLFGKSSQEMLEIGELCIRLQCLVLPVHGWVAVVNMMCAGLGDAKGALLLSTARQGTCFIPFVHLICYLFKAVGAASIQALADVLSLALAIPVLRRTMKRVADAEKQQESESIPAAIPVPAME